MRERMTSGEGCLGAIIFSFYERFSARREPTLSNQAPDNGKQDETISSATILDTALP